PPLTDGSIARQRCSRIVMGQDILVAPAVLGVADRPPLAHSAAVTVPFDIKDEAIQVGVIADRETLAAQAASVNTATGGQRFAEPSAGAGIVAAGIGAALRMGHPAIFVGGKDREPAVRVNAG